MTEVYAFIDAEYATRENAPAVTRMCARLEVSKSGFYDWKSHPETATAERQERLRLLIKKIFGDSDGTYGYRRIAGQLARQARAGCDQAEGRDWTMSADSTVVRAPRHAAGPRRALAAELVRGRAE